MTSPTTVSQSTLSRSPPDDLAPRLIGVFVAGLLLVAAALKAHQLATEPVANKAIFSYRWSLVAQVEFELFFGLWLLSGLHRRLTWAVAVGSFVFFAVVSLYKAVSGEASCGCFGRVEVSPWYTLVLDVAVVAALFAFRPDLRHPTPTPHSRLRLAVVLVLALVIGVPTGIVTASYQATIVDPEGGMLGHGNIVLLEPEKWVGKRFPLREHIDIGDQLIQGRWYVLFYHHDCPDCPEPIANCERQAREEAGKPDAPSIALIEVAPPRPGGRRLVWPGSPCVLGKVSEGKEWFLTTPATVQLEDGKVLAATEGRGR